MASHSFQRIAMTSVHGYMDPTPQLGKVDTGGQVVYVLQLARALARQGIAVDIYTRWFDRFKKQVEHVPGIPDVRVIRIRAGDWEFIPKERIYDLLPELSENMRQFMVQHGLEYDLFHGHYVDGGMVALVLGEIFRKPVVYTAHSLGAWKRASMKGDPVELENDYHFSHRIEEETRLLRQCHAVTLTSDLQAEKIDELYDYQNGNIHLISCGADVRRFRPLREDEHELPKRLPPLYVFSLTRFDVYKGHDLLLEAFDKVRQELPEARLIIGGGTGNPCGNEKEVSEQIRAIIAEKTLGEHVRQIGYVPESMLAPYYRQARLFALPSRFEPFGMSAIEAMACGTPVIASSSGGIREMIADGDNGLLVDATDADAFAAAMLRLLRDKPEADRLGSAAAETVRKRYSWEAVAEQFINCYTTAAETAAK
ncbi:MAG: glycosyltransferase [Candidatus Cloacimonetes bacterium]|nr:glycosyltransferase [Candidatus Cloacimonadota bacterium]